MKSGRFAVCNSMIVLGGEKFVFRGNDSSFFEKFTSNIKDCFVSEITVFSQNPSEFFEIDILPSSKHTLRDTVFGDVVCANDDWSKIDYFPVKKADSAKSVLLAAIYSKLCFYNVLLCHASLIDFNGHGILFVGPSGIGKTTQAEIWRKFNNAEIINGDKAFLKVENNNLVGYGLPWKGSSEYCLNKSVKIDAVIVLKQAKRNFIRKLSETEKLSLFVPHLFLPHWDENCMEAALKTLDKTVNLAQVFLLECLPDKEAVSLVEKLVMV